MQSSNLRHRKPIPVLKNQTFDSYIFSISDLRVEKDESYWFNIFLQGKEVDFLTISIRVLASIVFWKLRKN